MLESALKRRILKQLNAVPRCKAISCPQMGMGTAGTPDILGCYQERMFTIEAKIGKNDLTKIQLYQIGEWAKAGACTWVAREDFEIEDLLRGMFP